MSKNTLYKLDYELWLEKFKPQTNHINNTSAFDGYMYETYGEEFQYVAAQLDTKKSRSKIWTLIDCDGETYIIEGYHFINRLGYFITKKSFAPNDQYEINLNS